MEMLEIKDISKQFGGLKAVSHCNMKIEAGQITGLIGPNGAGKTTLFNVIAGYFPATEGEIYYRGEKITGTPGYLLARKGIVRTFQTARGFTQLTLMENLMAAPKNQEGENLVQALLMGPKVRRQEKENKEKALHMLETVGMADRRNEIVGNLNAGEARMVELVRQLMLDPDLLLLDEPAAGIIPSAQDKLLGLLKELQKNGKTLLVIDHNLGFITALSNKMYVMHFGEVVVEGDPDYVMNHDKVKEIYLGVKK
jgi:ABC-type branched-subunit amino acid transport system ATPase component